MLRAVSAVLLLTLGSRAAEEDPSIFLPNQYNFPNDEFEWRLTKQFASTTEQNFLISPIGLNLALAFLTEAATGTTATELQLALSFGNNTRYTARNKFQKTLDSLLTKSNQYIVDLESRIYIGNNAEPRQRFIAIGEEFYKTQVKNADLENATAGVEDINSWISNVTHGRIPKFVTADDVSGSVMLILNSLYFKGTWQHQFDLKDTRTEIFFATIEKVAQVPFMIMENNFLYVESSKMDAKILRLPYLGNKFSMFLIVPNTILGLPRVLSEMTQLRQEMALLTMRKVRVMLPRFQFEFASQLDGVLKELGIRQAFEQTASFPGIARGDKLNQIRIRISRVMQKSDIEINELGSSVYTAPEMALVNRFVDGEKGIAEVQANRPFIFFIEDESTRQLLFTGRISNPSASPALPPVIFLPLDNI